MELAAACVGAGVPLVPIPGACAAVCAISVSGFPSSEFVFFGFLPRKGYNDLPHTLCLFSVSLLNVSLLVSLYLWCL